MRNLDLDELHREIEAYIAGKEMDLNSLMNEIANASNGAQIPISRVVLGVVYPHLTQQTKLLYGIYHELSHARRTARE